METTVRTVNISVVQAFVLTLLILLLVGFLGYFAVSSDSNALLCGSACCALMVLLLPQLLRKSHDLFEPINFVVLTTLIGVVLRTFYIVFVESENTRSFLLLGQPPIFLYKSLLIINLGLICLVLGYSSRTPTFNLNKFSLMRSDSWNKRRLFFVLFIFTALALLSIVLYVNELGIWGTLAQQFSAKRKLLVEGANYEYAALGYYLWGASLMSYVFYFLFALFVGSPGKLHWPLGIVVVVLGMLSMIFPVITSSRGEVLYHLVYAVLIWHYLKRRISLHKLTQLVSVALAIFVLLAALRGVGQSHKAAKVDEYFEFSKIIEVSVGNRNWFDVSKTAHIVDAVPRKLEYQYGESFIAWIFAPIPRTLWKEKPIVRVGPVLGERIFQREVIRTGVPPGFIGELYWNFGIIGVPFGMFFLGFGLKTLYRSFCQHITQNRNALLIYIFIMIPFSLTLLSDDFSGVVLDIATSLIPLLLTLKFIRRKKA
jgi:oligosaccharide repeat unit polymerase